MRQRGWKQRRVHFHAKRKLDSQRRKFSEAIFSAISEHFVENKRIGEEFMAKLRIPDMPIQGRFMCFDVKETRESQALERQFKREALRRSYRVRGSP